MGLLSKLFGISTSVGIERQEISWTDAQVDMLKRGYKRNFNDELFPPDTVWAGPRSKVYHVSDSCSDGVVLSGYDPIPESEGVRRGLHRCKKCTWGKTPVPAPCRRPVTKVKPVSQASIRILK